jgi:hypothetical protein
MSSATTTTTTTTLASTCTKYYCSTSSWTITWSYCPALKHTAAVMWHREGDGDQRKAEVLADLVRLQHHLAHPMLLGFIKTKISLSFTFDMLDDMNRETLELEQAIGFPTWNWLLDRVEPGRGVGDSQDQAIEGFNILSGKLTNIRFRLRTFQQQIKFISRCNAGYRLSLTSLDTSSSSNSSSPTTTTTSSSSTASNFEALLRECDELQLYMDVMWDYTFVHLTDADSLGERLQNAMNSVFQLTTQRDSRASLAIADINNELAWQGRNNNTAMMTIAFISLLFLPGTFVASFFQTPIFNFPDPNNTDPSTNANNYSSSSSSRGPIIVAQPFWIYWTVSGVLTLGLGLGWMSYLRRRREMDRKEREFERRQFRDRIRRRKDGGAASFVLERGPPPPPSAPPSSSGGVSTGIVDGPERKRRSRRSHRSVFDYCGRGRWPWPWGMMTSTFHRNSTRTRTGIGTGFVSTSKSARGREEMPWGDDDEGQENQNQDFIGGTIA